MNPYGILELLGAYCSLRGGLLPSRGFWNPRWDPKLVQKPSIFGSVLGPHFGSLGAPIEAQKKSKDRKSGIEKCTLFLEDSGRLPGFSEPSCLSRAYLEKPYVPKDLQKQYRSAPFQNRFFSLSWQSWIDFGGRLGLFWAVLGPEMEPTISIKTGSESRPKIEPEKI